MEMTCLLISVGADTNACGINQSVISYALQYASFPVVSQLLSAGAVLPDNALELARGSNIDFELKVSAISRALGIQG